MMKPLRGLAIVWFGVVMSSLAMGEDRYQSLEGHPADHLPPYIQQVSGFGERPEWSHDGQRILFVEKPMGEVYELDLASGLIRPKTRHFHHYGFTRANYLANGDILLAGPNEPYDAADSNARKTARDRCWLSVLCKSGNEPPVPLGTLAAEGPAVSRSRMKIAWTHRDHQDPTLGENHARHYIADIVYEGQRPKLARQRIVFDSRQLPFPLGSASLETQDFVPPDDTKLIFSVYRIEGGNNTDTFIVDTETGEFENLTRSPDHYDEAEGVFPDGLHTCVEHAPSKHSPWPLCDNYKLRLDGSGEMQRLTYFSEFKGYKATQGIVSDDGRKLCFQIGKSGDEAGVGYGFFVMDLEAAAEHLEPFRSYAEPPPRENWRWKRHATDLPEPIWAVDAIDVNGDGRLQLIAVGATAVWSVDPVDGSVSQLAETPGGRTIHAVALDMDGDGDHDLALGRASSDWIRYREASQAGKTPAQPLGEDWTVAWLENPGAKQSTAKRLPWRLHVLDRELHGVHGLAVGDIDADGKLDLIADSFEGPHLKDSLAWFRGGLKQPSERRMITNGGATGRPHYMDFADIDNDGLGDVLLGASAEGSFTWWKQPHDLNGPWQRYEIAWEPGATHPRAVDVNKDGRIDVIGSTGHGVGVFWYEAPLWTKRVVDPLIRDVHAFDVGDLDGDGDVDLVGCSFSRKTVRWWENVGEGRFVAHDLDTENEQEAYDLKVVDLTGNGRLEVLLAGRNSKNVVWYERVGDGDDH